MRKMLFLCCWLIVACINANAQFTKAEFYFDTDPGIGKATPVSFTSSNDAASFTSSLPTTSLAPGFHFAGMRVKNDAGGWSLTELRGFYISTVTADAASITAAEYFIDADPGAGNGLPLSVGAATGNVNFSAVIPTASLGTGFHFLGIRTKGSDGKWGLFETRGFFISGATADAANIVSAEYFIDTDPGAGNGLPLNIGSCSGAVNFTATVPTTSLAKGFHLLAIRTKGSDGAWGLFESRSFFISTQTLDVSNITAAEFFIDVDPGAGKGAALAVSTPGATVSQSFVCAVPPGTTNGSHILFLRVKDATGNWGLFERGTFTVDQALPVTGLHLSAVKKASTIQLDWTTLTETNSSHFELEKSKNGIDFTGLAHVNAAGSSSTKKEYTFTDATLFDGLNYYRLKQVDKDGLFVYSSIVTVYNATSQNQLAVYPNPAQSIVNIAYKGMGDKAILHLFNQQGQLIQTKVVGTQSNIQLQVQHLAAGKYYIRISDGAGVLTTTFEKL